jgi:hypothetical protein
MAGLAKAHQVIIMVAAAIIHRNDVVEFAGRGKPPGLLAFGTEGILGEVKPPDFLPAPIIMGCIYLPDCGLMIWAISVSGSDHLRAAWVEASPLGFIWHHQPSIFIFSNFSIRSFWGL